MASLTHKVALDTESSGITEADHTVAFLAGNHAPATAGRLVAVEGGWSVTQAS